MIYGIGTDIAAVGRFRRFIAEDNQRLLERLFTPDELKTCSARKDAASCYAARFAAKEAFLKALGTGLRDGLSWHDIQVVNDDLGKPGLILSGKAEELYRLKGLQPPFISLSHDGDVAVAMVVLESP